MIGKDERHGNQGDMDAQPGNPIGLVDEHQSDCQGNIEDPLKEQGDAEGAEKALDLAGRIDGKWRVVK